MSDDIRPTAADLARDLRADLAVVEKAAPGPWNSALRIDGTPDDADVFVPVPPHGGGNSILTNSPHSGLPRFKRNEDAHAVGLMREAWPAAIRRALAAEAEVARLRECLLWIASADWLLAWDLRALADEALSGAGTADFPRKRSDDA